MTKRWNELDEYLALHRIWLPKALESAMAELTDMYREYREHARKLESALDEWARPQPMDSDLENAEALNESLNQGHELYEDTKARSAKRGVGLRERGTG
jgi:hypothetical protein